jgi:hypothetical protein
MEEDGRVLRTTGMDDGLAQMTDEHIIATTNKQDDFEQPLSRLIQFFESPSRYGKQIIATEDFRFSRREVCLAVVGIR